MNSKKLHLWAKLGIFTLLLIIPLLLLVSGRATSARELALAVPDIPLNQADVTALSKGFLTGPNDGEALEIALRYLEENKDALGLSDADLADLIVTDQYVSQHNGVTHIYLRQRFNEIEVFGGNININIAADGSVINVGNRFVRCDVLSSPPNTPNTNQGCVAADSTARPFDKLRAPQPSLSAIEAVESAAEHLGLSVNQSLTVERRSPGSAQEVLLSDGGISQDSIPVKLVYQPVEGRDELRLAWDITIHLENGQNWWNLRVDALTGELLEQQDWIVSENWQVDEHGEGVTRQEEAGEHVPASPRLSKRNPEQLPNPEHSGSASAQYRVLPFPYVSPEDLGVTHTLVTDASDAIASPFGWHDTDGVAGAEFTDTRGNNVFAQDDVDGNNSKGFRPDGGADLLFDFAVDSTFQPSGSTNLEAAIVNLFYWNNIIHDIFYHYGFDEASGNFQQNNYGKGGQENDPLQADVQDRSGTNNANFASPPDGEMPRMQMFRFTFTTPNRDSALDNGVIVHEYGHGISTRLTGGPSNANCLFNSEQMGEGWSDWLALAVTAKESASLEPHGIAPYLLGQPPDGRGIRSFHYSTDMTINPQTYDTIKKAVTVHKVGEVWAGMLWEVYWSLVDKHGFNPNLYHDWNTGGNNLAIQLVIDGMKLQPCEPGFVDGRDAILQADMLLTGGANQCPIWHAFAKRGLGVSAEQGSSNKLSDGSQAFDLPPACQFLEVTPVTQDICVGERADYQLQVGPGYSSPVSMSASGTPPGTSFGFMPNAPLTPPSSATFSIANTERAEAGNYTVTITGTGSDISSDMTVELNVFDGVPGSVTLTEPSDHATNVSRNRTFTWIAATQGVTYTIEVDDDPAFSSIDYRATVSDTTHTAISSFNPKQTYYWRVQATNHCGTGPHLSSGSFTTKEVSPILVVDDDHNTPDVRPYYMDILEGLGYNIDIWDTTQWNNHELDASFLAPYEMVIWFSGDFSGDSADDLAGPSQADETALGSYLDRGDDHCLFLTSQSYHQDRGLTRFMQSHLGVDSILENQSYTTVTGSGSVFGQLGPHALSFPQNNYSDVLLPNESADVAFSSDKGSAAIYKENGDSRALFFGFPFESIATNSERQEVMQSIIEWCGLNEDIALLTGRVTDADSGRPIQGATVTANNGRSQRSATTNYTGHYTMSLTVDQYDLIVSALNYEQQVISLDTPLHDRTSRQDFVLQGSSLTYDSLSLEESLQIGEVVTNTITITNSGPLPIDYKVTVGGNYRYFMPLVMAGPNSSNDFSRSKSSNDFSRSTSSNDFSRSTSSNDFSRSDDFGYTIIDSNESAAEGPGPMYKFIDIKESGTRVALDENESDGPFPMGFDFNFYGTSQNEFYISSNGFISFDSDSDSLSNQCLLPHTRAPSNLIALMWDDLDPQYTQDYVYYQSFTSCPYGSGACLIVQYDKYHYFPGIASSTSTFEAILFERGDILIQYAQVGHKKGAGSTTGIENADGTIGLTYGTCNTPNHLADKLAICFAHPEGNACDSGVRNWAKVAAESGTIPPNSSTTLDVIFDSTAQFQTDDLNAYLWFSGHFVNNPDPLPLTMSLSCPTCGLLSGFITDADNDEWLSGGIEVTGPDDFNLIINSHNYNMEVEPGTYNFTVNANGYLSQTATMTVTSGLTVTTDFPLIANVAKLNFSPLSIDKSLSMGDLVTHTMTITNSGVAELTLEVNLDHFEGPRLEKGLTSATESQWLSGDEDDESQRLRSQSQLNANSGETKCISDLPSANSQSLKGVEVATNRGTQLVYPSTYRWAGNDNTFNILLYADDSVHKPPVSLPDQALQAKGFTYTAIYHNWDQFETCLTTETWDLVLVANDQGIPPGSTLTALNDYVTKGGKLIFHGWTVRDRRDHPLWQTLGFTWKSNVGEPDPVYWWQTKHPIFTNPKSVPQLTDLNDVNYRIYGQRVEPLPGALPLAGYTPDPNANEAALILANDGRTVFKAFLDVQNSADLDEDGILDGVELWMNLIVGIQTGFDASAQWPRMIPDSATIAPNSSATFDLVFDASSLYEVGDYRAQLAFSGNFVNDPGTIPLSMEVTCPTCGVLNGSITAGNTANPLPANIQVTGPNDFDVTITGDSYNLTLLPGRYDLSVESSGYFTKTASVKITEGKTTTTDFDLLAKIILLPLVSK